VTAEWRGPSWLKPFLADWQDSIFHRVTSVELSNREVPSALLKLQHLESLSLRHCRISREQLQRLHRPGALQSLTLLDNHVAGEDALATAGPIAAPAATKVEGKQDPAWDPIWQSPCREGDRAVALACPSSSATSN